MLQPEFLFRNSADQAAARQERYYSNNSEYAADAATLGVPAATEHGYFAITIDNTCGAACYVLTATAQGGQVNDTGCTSLTLSSTGEKGPPGAEQCWGQ